MSYIDHLELRTRTRDFDLNQQLLRFRAYTNFPTERKIHNQYLQKILDEEFLNRKEQLNHLLKDRYKLIVNWVKNEKVLRGKKELEKLLEDRISILRQNSDNLNFDHQELLNAENEYHKLILDKIDLDHKLNIAIKEAGNLLDINQNLKLSTIDMVNVKDIEQFIKTIDPENNSSNFHLAQQNVEVELADLEYKKKKASEMNLIKYLEASYRDDLNDDLRKDLTVGLGIRIPIGSSTKSDLSDQLLEITKERNKLNLLSYEIKETINGHMANLEVSILKYNTLSNIIKNDGQENSLRKYQSVDGISPLVLLKVKENIIEKRQILLDLEKDIFTEYLALLDICGLLAATPFTNYFSKYELHQLMEN